jgi:hypothetical protein
MGHRAMVHLFVDCKSPASLTFYALSGKIARNLASMRDRSLKRTYISYEYKRKRQRFRSLDLWHDVVDRDEPHVET